MKAVLIPGTWSWRDDGRADWWHSSSPFAAYLSVDCGVEILPGYVWDTEVGGIGFGNSDLLGWKAAGLNLKQFCIPPRCPEHQVPSRDLILIAHSHALQVALFACAAGLKVRLLISVGSPIRKDMMPVAKDARPNIGHWAHFYGGKRDRMQWFGELFDGQLGVERTHPLADQNIGLKELNHSELLHLPAYFPKVGAVILGEGEAV